MRFSRLVPLSLILAIVAVPVVRGQITTFSWGSATSGTWFTGSNWVSLGVPNNLSLTRATVAATGAAYTVSANGATSIALLGLDVTSANATVVFDFATTGNNLSLGSSTSTLSAGLVDLRTL